MSEDNRVNETENEIEVHEVQSTPVSEEKKKEEVAELKILA